MQLTNTWKEGIAHLVRRWPFDRLMAWGVRLTVPRQRVGVALVTFNANEEVLLLRHVFHPANPWGLPGGWLARNEAPEDGLAREMREELGLGVVLDAAPICVWHEKLPGYIVLAYLGRLRPGSMRLNAEIIEARWFGMDHLPHPLRPFTQRAIAAGLAHSRVTPPAGSILAEVRQPA